MMRATNKGMALVLCLGLVAAPGRADPPCVNPPPGMLAWWPLDETGDALARELVAGRDGVRVGQPLPAPGRVSGALDVGGAANYVDADHAGTHDPLNLTLDAWVYLRTLGPRRTVLDAGGARAEFYALYVDGSELLFEACDSLVCISDSSSGANIAANQWVHLAVTASAGGTITFFVNGAAVSSSPYGLTAYSPMPNHWRLGADLRGNDLDGLLDEVEIFDRALDAGEVLALAAAGASGKCRRCPDGLPACFIPSPCNGGEVVVRSAGCLLAEAPAPGPDLLPFCAGSSGWGVLPTDLPFCHTFSGLPSNIATAVLEIEVEAGPAPGTCDDAIFLQVFGNAFAWSRLLGTGGGSCPGTPGLLATPWLPGARNTFCLNLGELPLGNSTTFDLVPYLNATGRLDIQVRDDSGVHYARLWLALCPPCARRPGGLVAWWPYDEATGAIAHDIVGGNHGALGGDAAHASGRVGNGIFFDGSGDFVQAPDSNALDFGTGSYSIDAWVHWQPALQPFSGNTIVQKLSAYRFMLLGGGLGLHVHLAPNEIYSPHLTPTGDVWHHMVSTIDQGDGSSPVTNGIRIYVDGALFGTVTPDYIHNLTNDQPLIVGGFYGYMGGTVDEVEIFNRVLSPTEIQTLYNAGAQGKCKTDCYAPRGAGFCPDVPSVTAYIGICNLSSEDRTYVIGFQPLPAGGTCSVDGPAGITASGPNPRVVPAMTCANIPIQIDRPAGLAIAGQTACFRLCVTALETGQTACCDGSVRDARNWCVDFVNGPYELAIDAAPTPIAIVVVNSGAPAAGLDYRVRVLGPENSDDPALVSLNGLPPGEPVLDTLSAPPGGAAVVPLTLRFAGRRPGRMFTLMIEADLDGDGELDPIGSTLLRSAPPPGCPPVVYDQSGDQVATEGAALVLNASVAALQPAALRWMHNGRPLSDDERIRGATAETLVIAPVTAGDAGMYMLEATDGCGASSGPPVHVSLGARRGDLDCDGRVTNFDIDPFVQALSDPAGYHMDHHDCDRMNADCNGDGSVDNFDIDAFVALIGS
jgi:hypothetical protein